MPGGERPLPMDAGTAGTDFSAALQFFRNFDLEAQSWV
jgi:hypothetical protein